MKKQLKLETSTAQRQYFLSKLKDDDLLKGIPAKRLLWHLLQGSNLLFEIRQNEYWNFNVDDVSYADFLDCFANEVKQLNGNQGVLLLLTEYDADLDCKNTFQTGGKLHHWGVMISSQGQISEIRF